MSYLVVYFCLSTQFFSKKYLDALPFIKKLGWERKKKISWWLALVKSLLVQTRKKSFNTSKYVR